VLFLGSAVTLPLWKPYAKRWKWFVVATNVYQDTLRRFRLMRGQIGQPASVTGDERQLRADLERINSTFHSYLDRSGLKPPDLTGMRVLEIGAGYNIGVALRFCSAGARRIVSIDKFVPLQDTAYTRDLYQTLRRSLPDSEEERFDEVVAIGGSIRLNNQKLSYVYGKSLEELSAGLKPASFDLIVSNAVLEEIYDLDPVFAAMDHLLAPGGMLIHNIDLGDYGMFTKHGFHPLEFLTIPEPVYRYMVECSGQPNRKLVNYYRGKMTELGYRSEALVTRVLGRKRRIDPPKTQLEYGTDYSEQTLQLIREIRPRLAGTFRSLPDQDLMIQGIALAAKKPVTRGSN
jgi:SAM-dependent methyltransferase